MVSAPSIGETRALLGQDEMIDLDFFFFFLVEQVRQASIRGLALSLFPASSRGLLYCVFVHYSAIFFFKHPKMSAFIGGGLEQMNGISVRLNEVN